MTARPRGRRPRPRGPRSSDGGVEVDPAGDRGEGAPAPAGAGTVRPAPRASAPRMSSTGCHEATAPGSTPSSSRWRRAPVVRPSPQILSRGNVALSITATDRPARARVDRRGGARRARRRRPATSARITAADGVRLAAASRRRAQPGAAWPASEDLVPPGPEQATRRSGSVTAAGSMLIADVQVVEVAEQGEVGGRAGHRAEGEHRLDPAAGGEDLDRRARARCW